MIKSLQRNHIYYIVEKDFLQIDRSVPFVSDASDDPCTSTSLVIYGGRYQAKGGPAIPTPVVIPPGVPGHLTIPFGANGKGCLNLKNSVGYGTPILEEGWVCF